MATCIHPSLSCLPHFYTIPIFPLLNRKIIYSIYFKDRLPEAICCKTCSVNVVLLVMCYQFSLSLVLRHLWVYLNILPEASCCWLVVVYKPVMCMESG